MGKIGITCRQPFLGADEWIAEEIKKADGHQMQNQKKKRNSRSKGEIIWHEKWLAENASL